MRWLLDHNLSPRLAADLQAEGGQAEHVLGLGLARASDEEVWAYAAAHGFTIVTKDADFQRLSLAWGAPPKVVWLRTGNCSTGEAAALLRRHAATLQAFVADEAAAVLEIVGRPGR